MKLFRWRRGISGRRRKLIRRKAVPGGISGAFSEHRGNSVSSFLCILFSPLSSFVPCIFVSSCLFFPPTFCFSFEIDRAELARGRLRTISVNYSLLNMTIKRLRDFRKTEKYAKDSEFFDDILCPRNM